MCFVKEKNGLGLSILFCRATLVHGNNNLQLSHARMILQASCFEGISLKSTGSCRPKSDGYLLIGQIFAHGHKAEKTSLRVTQSKSFAAKLSPYLENTVEETYMTR